MREGYSTRSVCVCVFPILAPCAIRRTNSSISDFSAIRPVVSDNGPHFISEEFEQFLVANGVNHIRSSPYHPSTNEAAERVVQTVKQALCSCRQEGLPLEHILANFLLQYRTTPHATTGVCSKFLATGTYPPHPPGLTVTECPRQSGTATAQQQEHHDRRNRFRELSTNQPVWFRNFRDGRRWLQGVVADRMGPSRTLFACHMVTCGGGTSTISWIVAR